MATARIAYLVGGLAALAVSASASVTAHADGAVAEARAATSMPAPTTPVAPDCYCTDSDGARVELGALACLRIGRREMTARCGMSLNNPAWRMVRKGCPLS